MNQSTGPCPVCRSPHHKEISESILACRQCGIIFNADYRSLSYDRDYFISDYTKQYGRSYLDDYANIYRLSCARLRNILSSTDKQNSLSLLDIGCAAGFFLKAAMDTGINNLKGVEVSAFAAAYCRETFGITVIESPFESAIIDDKFDIITSWFFLEHCADPIGTINRIYGLLNKGGIFALAVPSYFGPMFYFNRKTWIETHPADHRIDISPRCAKTILKDAGFRKVKVIKSGYHPERIVSRDAILYRLFEPVYRLFTSITAFSDTIEIYAIK